MEGAPQLDLSRIKGNVAKMVSMGAPEAEIDGYLSHEGTTPEVVRAYTLPNNDARETEQPGTLKDVGLSVAGVPQEVAARAVGMPGDIAALGRSADALSPVSGMADKLGNYLAEKATGRPATGKTPEWAVSSPVPTTQQVKQGVTDATGMQGFYKPQTAAGGMVQEGLVGALMGAPAGTAATVSGLAQGVAGEGARRVFKGTAMETPASVVAALAAGGLPSAARAVGAVSRPGDILARALENVTPQQMSQAQTLMDDAARMGVKLTGPEAIQQVVGGQTRLGTLQRQVEQAPTGEAQLRPMMMARPGEVQAAGEGLLENTFGQPRAPEQAASGVQKTAQQVVAGQEEPRLQQTFNALRAPFGDATTPEAATQTMENAATGAVDSAMKQRTEQSGPFFSGAKKENGQVLGLRELVNNVTSRIATSGAQTELGRSLSNFRSLLLQGHDQLVGKIEEGLTKQGVQRGSDAWNTAVDKAWDMERPLGPLMTGNRETAWKLQQKYNPGLGPDQPGVPREIAAELGPLNEKFTATLGNNSTNYGQGLKTHAEASPAVNAIYEGPVGRIANMGGTDVGGRLTRMSDEFLSPDARPEDVQTLITHIGKIDPSAVGKLIGSKLENMWGQATQNLEANMTTAGGKMGAALAGNPIQLNNLKMVVENLPGGKSIWPSFKQSLDSLQAPDYGALGRLAAKSSGDPATRLTAMADEFLDPQVSRPVHIEKLAGDLSEVDPEAVRHLIGARLTNIFNNSMKELQSGPNPWGGAKFVTETMGNPQARANLEATIKALPNGAQVWPGWVKFSDVMKATGKRLPRGSDTAVNLGVGDELKNATGLLQRTATGPLSVGKGALEDYAARANASTLGKIFADPQAVEKMRQLAILNPASRKAQALVGEILAITGSMDRNSENGGTGQ